jgi:peptidoglycan/LPS O-acetylase OafA/YrhL
MAGRVQQLDVLRGVAVLLVLAHHSPGGEGAVLKGGWTGVDLFFVLSGFLVSGLLFKEYLRSGHIRPGRFYLRRGLKIYPNFYTMLAVTSAALAWGHIPVDPRRVIGEIVFVQNYVPAAWPYREHAWSLAIEEHFYFLLPPMLMLLLRWRAFRRAPVRGMAALIVALGVAVLAVRWATVRSARGDAFDVLFFTHTRIDALAFGVLLSVLWHFAPSRIAVIQRHRWVLLALGLLLVAPSFLLPLTDHVVLILGLTLNYLGYGMVLAAVLTLPRALPRPLAPILAYVGFYSYSIYLWHLPFLALLLSGLGRRPLAVPLFYAGSILVGVAMAKLVELPALRLRERWLPAPRAL